MEDSHKIEYKKFIDDIPKLFNETKFVICRSGAGTITELQAYGMPAILFHYQTLLMIIKKIMP